MKSGQGIAPRPPEAARQSDNVAIWCLKEWDNPARFRNRYGGFNGFLPKAGFQQTAPLLPDELLSIDQLGRSISCRIPLLSMRQHHLT
jgi:hypothetical protein